MGRYMASTQFLPFTATASSSAADHPPPNVGLLRWGERTWRAGTTGLAEYLQLDLGPAAPGAVGLFADYTTATVLSVRESATAGGTYATIATLDVEEDERVGNRRKGFWMLPTSQRHVRVHGTALRPGADTFEVGRLVLPGELRETPQNPGQPEWQPLWPRDEVRDETNRLLGVNVEGPPRIAYTYASSHWKRDSTGLEELLRLFNVGPAGTCLLYENAGRSAHAYLLHPIELSPVRRGAFFEPASLRLEEWG